MTKCSKGCSQRPRIGDLKHKISLKRMALNPSVLGQSGNAGAEHDYVGGFEAWAKIDTIVGRAEYAQVEVGGERVTHKFWIRDPGQVVDIRDVVEYASCRYQILGVENINEMGQWLILHCRFKERI